MISYKKLAVAALLGFTLLGTSALADKSAKGQSLYAKKLKDVCNLTGGEFAEQREQADWEEAKENGTLGEVMTEICPAGEEFFNSDKFKSKYNKYLYDFVYKFASDSGNVPSC